MYHIYSCAAWFSFYQYFNVLNTWKCSEVFQYDSNISQTKWFRKPNKSYWIILKHLIWLQFLNVLEYDPIPKFRTHIKIYWDNSIVCQYQKLTCNFNIFKYWNDVWILLDVIGCVWRSFGITPNKCYNMMLWM